MKEVESMDVESPSLGPLVAICGPTASRKSELAMALAQAHNGEIICCDSIQMVKGFVIGAASPSDHDYKRIPHHLYQTIEWHDPPDAGRYQAMADQVIQDVYRRGKLPIVVGGTGLYLRALLSGLANIPSVPTSVRERLLSELATQGEVALFERLRRLDPVAAERISGGARNAQRVIRALEVAEHTGRPLSSFWAEQETGDRYDAVLLSPVFDTAVLAERISNRVGRMLDDGLLREVESLLASGVDPACRAMTSLGYREANQHLRGEITLNEARQLIERGHRRYARRQRTWFKAVNNVHSLDASRTSFVMDAELILQKANLVVPQTSE